MRLRGEVSNSYFTVWKVPVWSGLLPQSMLIIRLHCPPGILYCNGAHASTESVTNTALYHLISVFTHATYSALAARSLSRKNFQEAHTQIPKISHNPAGHTLGIVGLGNIGYTIAKKVKVALGMKILYYDVIRKSPAQEAEVNAQFYPTLESLLPNCDALLLATPSGPPILTSTTLSLLPRGARIVNIARGSLIDEEALADALDCGHISAAGLDVHAREPRINERFVGMRQVCLTCHTGGASVETNNGFERLVMENVEAVLEGGEALTAVNMHLMKRSRNDDGIGSGHDDEDEDEDDDDDDDDHDENDGSSHDGEGKSVGKDLDRAGDGR